jgi:hypothetical protein
MGQYYKPIILKGNKTSIKAWSYSHDYSGFNGLKLMEHSWLLNKFVGAFESQLVQNPQRVVWAGDYAEPCKNRKSNLYTRCKDKNKFKPTETVVSITKYPFLVNHSKKEYIDKRTVRSNDGWRIHPLPLMTCEGNGQGGGDYRGNDKIVGTWARDLIEVRKSIPNGYKEIKFTCYED